MTKRRRTPLGREIRAILRGERSPFWPEIRDSELGKRLEVAARYTAHEQAQRPVRLHEADEAPSRRRLALVLMLAESARRHPRTQAVESCGARVFQGWLAKRLRCSVKTVQRDLRCLEAAKLVETWQPDGLNVPEHMRAKQPKAWKGGLFWAAYNVYRWSVELPATIKRRLMQWRQHPELPPAGRLATPPAPEVMQLAPVNERARELLDRFGAKLGIPPPEPAG